MTVTAIDRIVLVTLAMEPAVTFFRDALGFQVEVPPAPATAELLLGMPGARGTSCRLRLNGQQVELVQYEPAGAPYSGPVDGNDPRFQHFAMVVRDMEAALRRLDAVPGWSAITRGGPQRLPPENGGVLAFKFRDPEGHPLEFLQFPAGASPWDAVKGEGAVLGIDHTAISVADAGRSTSFFVDGLGFRAASQSLNQGEAQERLDALPSPRLDVVGLNPGARATPHLELLGYHRPAPSHAPLSALADAAATRTVLRSGDTAALLTTLEAAFPMVERIAADAAAAAVLVRDPDGHLFLLVQ